MKPPTPARSTRLLPLALVLGTGALIGSVLAPSALLGSAPRCGAEPQIAQLRTAALTISRKDPFGYITAFTSSRKQLEESFRTFAKLDIEQTGQLRKLMTDWDGDQLLYVLVITRPGAAVDRSAPTVPNPALHPLRELLSVEGLTVALGEAEQTRRWVSAGNIDVFADRQIPEIGRVHEHRPAARADLGRTITLLGEKKQVEPAPGR